MIHCITQIENQHQTRNLYSDKIRSISESKVVKGILCNGACFSMLHERPIINENIHLSFLFLIHLNYFQLNHQRKIVVRDFAKLCYKP